MFLLLTHKMRNSESNIVKTFPKLQKNPSEYKLFTNTLDSQDRKSIIQMSSLEGINDMIRSLDKNKYIHNKRKSAVNILPKFHFKRIQSKVNNVNSVKEIIEPITKINDINQQKINTQPQFQEENFGAKYKKNNPELMHYDSLNKEEFINYHGISDFNLKLKSKFLKRVQPTKSNKLKNIKQIDFKLIKDAHDKLMKRKDKIRTPSKEKLSKSFIRRRHYERMLNEIKRVTNCINPLIYKNEFQEYLIETYLTKAKIDLCPNQLLIKKGLRKIFVIQNSTVLSNINTIPGCVINVPTKESLKNLNLNQRMNEMKKCLSICKHKFQTSFNFEYFYLNNGDILNDFAKLSNTTNFLFVSKSPIYHGLSLPLNKNIMKLYKDLFKNKLVDNGAFMNSSFEESDDETNNKHYYPNTVYDIFFKKKEKAIKMPKNKRRLSLSSNNNHNDRILSSKSIRSLKENNNKDDYYCFSDFSDNEERRNQCAKELFKNKLDHKNNQIEYFIYSQNSRYDDKINKLKSKLQCNNNNLILSPLKTSKIFNRFSNDNTTITTNTQSTIYNTISSNKANNKKPKISKLIHSYFKSKHIPLKTFNKPTSKKSLPKTNRDYINSIKILHQKDPSFDINKFYLKSPNASPILPYVKRNIDNNTDRIYYNQQKTDKHLQHLISYNIPSILERNPQYSRSELIEQFTKFKSLVNLWCIMNHNVKANQFGIDFETFHNCTSDLAFEEKILVKKIFNQVNTGKTSMLSLEDFIDALTMMNKRELRDQMEFFLKVFDSTNKGEFSFEEVRNISRMAIKRIMQCEDELSLNGNEVFEDLSLFFAKYIFSLVKCDIKDKLPIGKLKEIIQENKKEMEYLQVFCCTYAKK